MSIFDIVKTYKSWAFLPKNNSFNPRMQQRPMIDAGNTGRYSLEMQMVAFNSPARGTLAPNSPRSNGTFLDVNAHVVGPLQGFNTIPNTPRRQGLVQGFRSDS